MDWIRLLSSFFCKTIKMGLGEFLMSYTMSFFEQLCNFSVGLHFLWRFAFFFKIHYNSAKLNIRIFFLWD
ncbi:hypothetical protein VK95_23405 [Leclercia sp. LK8]|nr:hypothetical protein VK95_23405 [Leclercia sp. LK8]